MAAIQLPRNVHFIYEHALAHLELQQGYGLAVSWDMTDPWTVNASLNGEAGTILERSAYVGSIDGCRSVYSQLVRPAYQGGEYNRTRSENQYLTHWIYPYKGKFHPQMIRAILNIIGARPGWQVADVFSGSGTTLLECQLLGIDALGIEISPLCAMLARVKTQAWTRIAEIRAAVEALSEDPAVDPQTVTASDWPPRQVSEFVEIARMVTFSDAARRGRDACASFQRNLRQMLESVTAMARAIETFGIKPGRVEVRQGDCRRLAKAGVRARSLDAIITSPPYSIALDYVQNDEHALTAMGLDTEEIRADFIGVRGKGTRQKVVFYERDMRQAFGEMQRTLKPGGHAVIVIGNVTLQGQESLTTDDITTWATDAGLSLQREMPKIVWGLYNLVKDEKILFFTKEK